jgi:hypothetical protein
VLRFCGWLVESKVTSCSLDDSVESGVVGCACAIPPPSETLTAKMVNARKSDTWGRDFNFFSVFETKLFPVPVTYNIGPGRAKAEPPKGAEEVIPRETRYDHRRSMSVI